MDCSLIATLLFTKTENPTAGFLDEPHKVFDNMQDRNRKMITKYKLCIRSLQKTSRWGTAGFPTSAENIGRGGSVQRKWGMHPLWEKGSSKFGACVCVCGGGGGGSALQDFFGGGAEVNILGSMWGTSKERENIL